MARFCRIAITLRWIWANLACAIAALCLFPSAALARQIQVEERADQIMLVFQNALPAQEVFSDEFLAAMPPSDIRAFVLTMEALGGPVKGIEDVNLADARRAEFKLIFEHGMADAAIQLASDPPHKVAGFIVSELTPADDTPEDIVNTFAALPGAASFGVFRLDPDGPSPLLTYQPQEQLAIGSTFKLYVLAALTREIALGRRAWSDIAELDERSISSGQMQNWPVNSPVTLHTLATMMISISDNTATDTLIKILGRQSIEAEIMASGHAAPHGMIPLMTTAQLFALKAASPVNQSAFIAALPGPKRQMLDNLDTSSLRSADINQVFGQGPVALPIEWFGSARDIALIFQRIIAHGDPQAMAILAVHPNLPPNRQADWRQIAYKGGSEPGVLNLSWLLQDHAGAWFIVTASWNNPDAFLDQAKFEILARQLVGLAAKGGD